MSLVQSRLIQSLEKQASTLPDKIALQDSSQSITFSEWHNQARAFASYLIDENIGLHSRVAILLDNCIEFGPIIYGTLMAGCVFVPINPETKGARLKFLLDDCKPSLIVCNAKTKKLIPEEHQSVNIICSDDQESVNTPTLSNALESDHKALLSRTITSDLATIIYTSGSTGNPKGVMHTHHSMGFASESIVQYLQLDDSHRILNTLPFSFDYGLYQLLFSAETGAFLYISQGFTFPKQVQELIDAYEISVLPTVPTSFQLLTPLWQREQPSLEVLTSTGEDLPPPVIELLKTACPNARIYKMYGLTECKRASYLPPEMLETKPKSVGKAIPGTRLLILNENLKPIAPGETGTLYVQGEHLMKGYWNQPELTAKVLINCPNSGQKMLSTGDKFTIDEEGDLYFAERSDDSFKIKGIKANPEEIENVIRQLDNVHNCAITYKEAPRIGKQLVAAVTGEASLKAQDIILHCRKELESHLIPRQILITDSLPTTPNGKLDRRNLPDWIQSLDK